MRDNKCGFCGTPVLPSVYDDSLSYLEQLCKDGKTLHFAIDAINDMKNKFDTTKLGAYINTAAPPDGLNPCKGDGITDDTEAFQAIINYAFKKHLPVFVNGTIAVSSAIDMPQSIQLMGVCSDSTNLDSQPALTQAASAINYIGQPIDALLNFVGICSANIQNISINCNNKVQRAIRFDCMTGGFFNCVTIANAVTGFHLVPESRYAATDRGCQFNTLINCSANLCQYGFYLDSGTNTNSANACHNVFINLSTSYTGAGIYMGDSDNNTFLESFCFGRPGATGYGVEFHENARDNYFYHFQGTALAADNSQNFIFNYSTENGQQPPVIEQTATLIATSNFNNNFGWLLGGSMLHHWYSPEIHGYKKIQLEPSSDTADGLVLTQDNTELSFRITRDGINYGAPAFFIQYAASDASFPDNINYLRRHNGGYFLLSQVTDSTVVREGTIMLYDAPSNYIGRVYMNGAWHEFGAIEPGTVD